MWAAVGRALASAGRTAVKRGGRFLGVRARGRAVRPGIGQPGGPSDALEAMHWPKGTSADTHRGGLLHAAGDIGQAMWGLDTALTRFEGQFSAFTEVVTVRVWGQRWASITNLYVLALSLFASCGPWRRFVGGEGINVNIDRTGKFIELEFQRLQGGLDGTLYASVFENFHNPNWLSQELRTPNGGAVQVANTLPTVLYHPQSYALARALGIDSADARFGDLFLAARDSMLAAYWLAHLPPDMTLVTHDKHTNPFPIFDGTSRGTDLAVAFSQHLHDPCDYPPLSEAASVYQVVLAPQGLFPEAPRPGPGESSWISAPSGNWWKFYALNLYRWFRGWVGGVVNIVTGRRWEAVEPPVKPN
jgi:hypothetical protein